MEFVIFPDPQDPTSSFEYFYYRYFLAGDTIFNGQNYKKLYEAQNNASLIDTSAATFIGGIRQDSAEKVYFTGSGPTDYYFYCDFPQPTNQEFLLYDFGVQVGDTFQVPLGGGGLSANVVLDIDTINIGGVMRRQYEISRNGEQLFFIEGIGSTRGLFYPYCLNFEIEWNLLCYNDPGISYNPGNANC